MDDFEEIKSSVEEVTTDVMEIARELELEVAPQESNKLLQSHDITHDKELFLMDSKQLISANRIYSW